MKRWKKASLITAGISIVLFIFVASTVYNRLQFKLQANNVYQTHVVEQSPERFADNLRKQEPSIITTEEITELVFPPKLMIPDLEHTVGAVHIPDVNVSLPIFDGTNPDQLTSGAVLLKGSRGIHMPQLALGGLSIKDSSNLFTPLLQIQEGMDIYITDKQEITYYTVSKVARVREGRTDTALPRESADVQLITGYESDGQDYHVVISATHVFRDAFNAANLGDLYGVFSY